MILYVYSMMLVIADLLKNIYIYHLFHLNTAETLVSISILAGLTLFNMTPIANLFYVGVIFKNLVTMFIFEYKIKVPSSTMPDF